MVRRFTGAAASNASSYRVTLENSEAAEAFAADFGGICSGREVTVTTKQSLEEIFMNYYGGEAND